LAPKCALRFPGRKVLTSDETYMRDDTAASWRTYDPTALVSIVLPVHNGARYLSHSIDSCLRQTHTNLELIIVDDGSIDDSSAIIKNYAALDSRIIVLTNKVNEGLPEALNRGFGVANGRFLTWTSDDNWYAPIQFMTQQLCTFPDIGLVYCGRHEVDEAGQVNNIYLPLPSTALARDNIVGACFMYRRAVMEVVGPYRPEYRYIEDWDFFLRACINFPSRFCWEPCYFYRFHSKSLTSAHVDKWPVLLAKLNRELLGDRNNRILLPRPSQLNPLAKKGSSTSRQICHLTP
jgi:glycosyltransferase involved in cell wall biosynthesis